MHKVFTMAEADAQRWIAMVVLFSDLHVEDYQEITVNEVRVMSPSMDAHRQVINDGNVRIKLSNY